jgi:DNA polymerase (family 10)
MGKTLDVDNAALAERLEAFAALLDLNGSSHYTVRAYRRAAELIRSTPVDVAKLVRAGASASSQVSAPASRPGSGARRDRRARRAGELEPGAAGARRVAQRCSASRRSGCASSGTRSGFERSPSCARQPPRRTLDSVPGIGPKTRARFNWARRARDRDGRAVG